MKILNITAGEIANNLFKKENELWVPFNEAMINGGYTEVPFTDAFIEERAKALRTSKEEYINKLSLFINSTKELCYDEIDLWFGDEPFCLANREFVISYLKEKGYSKPIILHILDEKEEHEVKRVIID